MIHRAANETSTSFFVVKSSPEAMLWSGPVAGVEGAKEIFGLQNVYGIDELPNAMATLKGSSIFLDFDSAHCSNKAFSELKNTKPLSPLIQELRIVKKPEEIDLMRESGRIASQSFAEVWH